MIAEVRHGARLTGLRPASSRPRIPFDAGLIAKPQLHFGVGAPGLEFLTKPAAFLLVLAFWPRLGHAQMEVQFVQPPDGGAVAKLQLQLFLEKTVEFDRRPMALADCGRIFQHRHEPIAHAFQFDFAPPAGAGLGNQGVDAATIEQLNPQPEHAVGAAKLLAERAAGNPQQQGTNRIEPEIGALIRRRFRRHAEFLERGVFRVRFNGGGAQPPSSAKSSQKVPELSSTHPEIISENYYSSSARMVMAMCRLS